MMTDDNDIKRCRKCKRLINFQDYYKNCKTKDGLTTRCKSCLKEDWQEYRKRNQEKIRKKHRKYYRENRKLCRQRRKDWEKRNPNYGKEYYHRNREKRIAYVKKYNHNKRNNGGRFSPKQWERLLEFYDGRCLWCGTTEDITIDHVIPITRGGSSFISNLQPLCKSCNSKKGMMLVDLREKLPPWIKERETLNSRGKWISPDSQ